MNIWIDLKQYTRLSFVLGNVILSPAVSRPARYYGSVYHMSAETGRPLTGGFQAVNTQREYYVQMAFIVFIA